MLSSKTKFFLSHLFGYCSMISYSKTVLKQHVYHRNSTHWRYVHIFFGHLLLSFFTRHKQIIILDYSHIQGHWGEASVWVCSPDCCKTQFCCIVRLSTLVAHRLLILGPTQSVTKVVSIQGTLQHSNGFHQNGQVKRL